MPFSFPITIESTLQEIRDRASVLDLDSKAIVTCGVRDVYGEDTMIEDQFVIPWSLSVAW